MTKFAIINQDGFPTAFYAEDIHGMRKIDGKPNPDCLIPSEAIEITDDQWQEFLSNVMARKWVDGHIVIYDPPAPEPIIPDRVSRRQFRQQLFDDGLLASVEGWINQQDERTQMAYADAGTFVRSDEMLQNGFTALGFTTQRVDKLFTDASLL